MEVKKVSRDDVNIINDILANHIDSLDGDKLPTITHLQKLVDDDRSYLFAAVNNNMVIGYALVYRFPSLYAMENLGYLYDIDVVSNHRQKGVGRSLMNAVIADLKKDGVNELWLGTAVDNIPAQRLFTATGGIKSGKTFYDYTYYLNNND